MGWLSKIFGGSSPTISDGHYHGTYGEETSWDYDPSVSLENYLPDAFSKDVFMKLAEVFSKDGIVQRVRIRRRSRFISASKPSIRCWREKHNFAEALSCSVSDHCGEFPCNQPA